MSGTEPVDLVAVRALALGRPGPNGEVSVVVRHLVTAVGDEIERLRAQVAESVPRSALVQVGWLPPGGMTINRMGSGHGRQWDDCDCRPVYVLREAPDA